MASPSDPCQDSYNHEVLGMPTDELMHWDDPGDALSDDQGHFFKVPIHDKQMLLTGYPRSVFCRFQV